MKQTGIIVMALALLCFALMLVLNRGAQNIVGSIIPFFSYVLVFFVFFAGVLMTVFGKSGEHAGDSEQ